jgi:hypothetical protein
MAICGSNPRTVGTIMPKTRSPKSPSEDVAQRYANPAAERHPMPAAALLSFLKQARGLETWTEKDLAASLKISASQAKQAMAILELQGYIQPGGHSAKWKLTEQGILVSGAKPPRFTRKSVEEALENLRHRIQAVNDDEKAAYRIADAVAFGDFLDNATRVQAAEVGIRLVRRSEDAAIRSAKEHSAELEFLNQLRAKSALLQIVPYESWMSERSHVQLL